MVTLNPYLTFNGNCEEAFDFYKSVFGGEFDYKSKFKDIPLQEGQPAMSPEMGERIMHVSLKMPNGTVLMGSDNNPIMGDINFGQNITLSLNVESKEEADRIFSGLSEEGVVTMPLADTFWGAYFGMFTDKFQFQWMVSFEAH